MENEELREKILLGLKKSFKKLLAKKKRENGSFVFAQNGKIVLVKAKDVKDPWKL